MATYLVTGGAGFIGSHIVDKLLKDGYKVRVLDNFSSGKLENLAFANRHKNFELIKGDIRNLAKCQTACKGVDAVLHQAALRSVPRSTEKPLLYNDVNITGTLNMLIASRDSGVKRFVFASSSSVYGETRQFPERETQVALPISPYAATKLTGESYCRIFSLIYGLGTVALRYFNVFGPRQSIESDYAVVVPKFITCLLKNLAPPIHGSGKQERDFTYIDNVVQANILSAKAKKADGEVFNIASGRSYSVLGLTKALNRIIGRDIKPVFKPKRPGDVQRTWADISKAKNLLGFKVLVDFEEGLKYTAEWFKDNYK